MKSCWAMQLGDCSKKISGEHVISKGLFIGDSIEVFGLPWTGGEKKVVGKDSITRNILCVKHNNELSSVDSAAKLTLETFQNMHRSAVARKKMGTDARPIQNYEVDGKLLERWFLKTLINIMYQAAFPIGDRISDPGMSSFELLEIAFGRKGFSAGRGLYFVYHEIVLDPYSRIEFTPIMKNDMSYIAGGLFRFGGLVFLLFCGSEEPPEHLKGITLGNVDLSDSKLFYHPDKMEVFSWGQAFQEVKIKW